MAIVEMFLLQQLEDAISNTPTTNLSMMFQLHDECNNLKVSIQKNMPKNGAPVNSIIKENLYYLNNVMTEWHTLLKEHHHLTPEAIHLATKLRGRLSQIKKDLQVVLNETMESESVKDDPRQDSESLKRDSETYKWSCRYVDLEKVYSIEDEAMIMERLMVKNEGFKAIGLVGMPGVGKTTLCQKAFDNQQVKQHFLPRIWVCLSKQPNVGDYKQELVKRILMGLGYERKNIDKVAEGGLSMLLLALRLQLKRQKYLIVLDDAWNVNEDFNNFCSSLTHDDDKKEDRLHYGLPKGHGGAVIVTCRSPIMIENMVGQKNLHRLPLADKESCWKIFKDAVEKDRTVKEHEFGVALKEEKLRQDEIVKKCAGLPLTAKILGQIEREKMHQSQTEQEP